MTAAGGLAATTGITIQGSAIALNGAITPAAAYGLPVSGSQVTAYVPPTSAALIQVS